MDVMDIRRALLMMVIQTGGDGMEYIKTYTVPESWENDTKGNTVSIYNTVLSDITKETKKLYVCVVKNNNASRYVCNAIVYIGTFSGDYGVAARNSWTEARNNGSTASTWVSAGATIDVYSCNIPE